MGISVPTEKKNIGGIERFVDAKLKGDEER